MTENDAKENEDAKATGRSTPIAKAKAKAKAEAAEKAREREPYDAVKASWGFPSFARDFPRDPDLDALVAAFARGDHAAVRTGAPALAAKTESDDVKAAALLLRARIEPDPTARIFFALTAALLVFLMVWWATHDGPSQHAPAPPKPPPTVEHVK